MSICHEAQYVGFHRLWAALTTTFHRAGKTWAAHVYEGTPHSIFDAWHRVPACTARHRQPTA
ncbi:hypothetical protein [Nonomuraea sp. NPDC049709]|uniref:hypothetical protein n=1 Tax=Nonomuraea sp. NPDC049709 TaxID=3154736 RepID=UPI00343096E9